MIVLKFGIGNQCLSQLSKLSPRQQDLSISPPLQENSTMTLRLPDALQTYFDVSNGGDVAQLASCFCPQATVFDENQRHVGIAAIEAWQHKVRKAFVFQVQPLQARQGKNGLSVLTRLAGNFPGSPVQLNHVFTLEGDLIRSLEITPC